MGAALVPVFVKDGDGYYIFANRAAELLLGYDPGQIGGKHISDLVESDPEWLEAEFQRFKTQRIWNGLLVFRHRLGDRVQAAVNAFMSTLEGGAALYTGLAHPFAGDSLPARPPAGAGQRYGLESAEVRLIQLLAAGFTDRDVASVLGLSEWAVSREVTIVLQKMRVSSRTEACMRAIKASLIY
jgi:PAS domain S-box-containing protein